MVAASEGERLVVDVPPRHAGLRAARLERPPSSARARTGTRRARAGQARARQPLRARGGRGCPAWAGRAGSAPCAPRSGRSRRVRAAGRGLAGVGPVDHGDVAGRAGQRLEQRPQRGDADPAGEQQHLAPSPAGGGERRRTGPRPAPAYPASARSSAALCAPATLTVIRSRSVAARADSEYGLAAHHRSRVRNRHRKNWPGSVPQLAPGGDRRCRPTTTSAFSRRDLDDPQPVPERSPTSG